LLALKIAAKEPWDPSTTLMIPFERTQVLVPESAAILGAQAFLKIARLPYITKEYHNAADISPNGNYELHKKEVLSIFIDTEELVHSEFYGFCF